MRSSAELPSLLELPAGRLRRVYLHWTAGDARTVSDAYHFCVTDGPEGARVVATADLRANLREVRHDPAAPYAAHVAGRNAWAAGIAVCAMADATPHNFGAYPPSQAQLDLACALAARLRTRYALPLRAVRTHAEAAVEDGYFGCGEGERWDVARLRPDPAPLRPIEAARTGDALRARVARA